VSADYSTGWETMLRRFERLLAGVRRGELERNSFEAWEVEILLDVAACRLDSRRRTEILTQYRNAVARQLRVGPGPPMLLSLFLALRDRRRAARGKR
jgi:hypothetical protein